MPNTTGTNENSKLEEIQVQDIQVWLKSKVDPIILENKLGNKILYPNTIPETVKDFAFELAILHKTIELSNETFYNKNLKRIEIPEEILNRIPDLQQVALVFIDALKPAGITSVWLKSIRVGLKSLGSIIKPEVSSPSGFVTLGVSGAEYKVKIGSLVIVPAPGSRADITFSSTSAKLSGKEITTTQVTAGQLGLIIDTRI